MGLHELRAYRCSPTPSGAGTKLLLEKAMLAATGSDGGELSLVVDGGSENNNALVSAFVRDHGIKKLVARVDVEYSNSMIEAVNKVLKYRYLFVSPIADLGSSEEAIGLAIASYNERPHYALKGLTPNAVHGGAVFDAEAYRASLATAAKRRRLENLASCEPCVPLDLGENPVAEAR